MGISSRTMLCVVDSLSTYRECVRKGWGAAGLALVTLNQYAGHEYQEVLVEPGLNPKANKVKPKPFNETNISVFKVYPNPTTGILLIEVPSEFKDIKGVILDGTGKEISNENGLNNTATLNLRNLSSGSYTLMLLSKEGKLIETQQIQIAK